ncbi:MAG: hypothetical protein J7518_01740 [Nocardioidaceae bacterium]|nr:hypothetical protein [Nocardioidaceae bacterium]
MPLLRPGPRRRPTRPSAVLLVAVLVLAGTGCSGSEKHGPKKATAAQSTAECRAQWHEVGQSVLGLDEETAPSSLPARWNTVVATIEYYEASATAKNCQATIEAQVKAITALRQLNDKLRPYDMGYQLQQVQAAVDLYLHDPLPAPARDEDGRLVKPPSKAAVQQAIRTLTANAPAADTELQPGWGQLASVDLDDATALRKAIEDLDQLAQDSVPWQACETALQVVVRAVRAQEGLGSSGPTSGPAG